MPDPERLVFLVHFDIYSYFDIFMECQGEKVLTTYNPGHNILELHNILVKIRFTTSETKLDI